MLSSGDSWDRFASRQLREVATLAEIDSGLRDERHRHRR
jgi:hypothetical protein